MRLTSASRNSISPIGSADTCGSDSSGTCSAACTISAPARLSLSRAARLINCRSRTVSGRSCTRPASPLRPASISAAGTSMS